MSALTTVSAANLCDATGNKITNATISFQPVTSAGKSTSFQIGGGGPVVSTKVSVQVANGAFTVELADTSQTLPVNVGFAVTVVDNVSGDSLLGPGYGCIQPTGANWSLDNYIPVGTPGTTVSAGPRGDSAYEAYVNVTTAAGQSPLSQSAWVASLRGPAGTIGVTTVPADTSTYAAVNPNSQLSTSALNGGITFFDAPGASSGIDFGSITTNGSAPYSLRAYIPDSAQWRMNWCKTPLRRPNSQSDFTDLMSLDSSSFKVLVDAVMAGNLSVAGALAVGSLNVSKPSGTVISSADYFQLNSNGNNAISNGSGLSAGLGLFSANGKPFFGLDFGTSGTYNYTTRRFAPDFGGFMDALWDSSGAPPVNDAGFSFIVPYFANKNGVNFFCTDLHNGQFTSKASIDANGNAAFASVTSTGTITGPLVLPPAAPIATSDAVLGNYAASLVQVRSEIMSRSHVRGYVRSRAGMNYHSYGDSITAGSGVPAGASYPYVVSAALGTTLTQQGVGGDEVADNCIRAFLNEDTSISSNVCFSVQIGTNDCNNKGVGAHEPVFITGLSALISWLATRSEDRVAAGSVTATGWSADNSYAVSGAKSSTNGSALTLNITTYGQPIFLWSKMTDGNGGAFSVSVDGGTAQSINAFPSAPISSQNQLNGYGFPAPVPASSGIQLTTIPVPVGAHTVTITVTSATGAGNVVSVVGVGTVSDHVYYASPSVVVGGVLPQNYDYKGNQTAQYTLDVMGVIEQMQSYGLDVSFVNNRPALTGRPDLYLDNNPGQLHPNVAGDIALAQPYIYALGLAPSSGVRKGTPLNTGKGTPGDSWAKGGYIYGVQADGSPQRTATSAW